MNSTTNRDWPFSSPHFRQQEQFPTPPFSSSSHSSSSSSSSSSASFSILVISVLGIITTAFLLVFYYVFVIKCCLNRRRMSLRWAFPGSLSRRRGDRLIIYSTAMENRGLEESVIRSIPIFRFEKEKNLKNLNECAVCLNEFQEDEKLRLLPNCDHAFHIDCIDTWLQSNANCPLCRSNISNISPFSRDQMMGQDPHQNSPLQHGNDRIGPGDVVIELGVDSATGQASRSQNIQNSIENPLPNMKEGRKFHHVCSMGDEWIDVRGKDQSFSIQPIRRSFSMDSSADRQLCLSVQEILQQNPNVHQVSSSSNGEGSSRIKRSFFSFGHGRSSRNSVLPLQMDQ